jgi:hypothetical protein
MRKTMVWAGLALTVGCVLSSFALSGCHKIRKCTIGEPGCVDEEPNEDGECADGLELRGDICVEPSGGSNPCGCPSDELCDQDTGSCIAYCAPEDDLPTRTRPPQGCEPPINTDEVYNYADLCFSTCQQACIRAMAYCPGFTCDPEACDNAANATRCQNACPNNDETCMLELCFDQQATACEDFVCPDGRQRDCSGIRCSDSCGENNGDGFCDDGDPASADYAFCSYGTDCADCGPRKGSRPPLADIGEVCPSGQDVACAGYNDDFLKTNAWCLRIVDDANAPFRCVPDCTNGKPGGGSCPPDYSCEAVLTSSGEPYTDAVKGTAGYYCQPLVCE